MTDYLDKYIDKLQKKRKELKISYDKLVEITGLPKSTITNTMLKYLKHSPSADVVNKIAIALQVPLLEEELQGVSNFEMTPDKEELLMLYEEIGGKLGAEAQRSFLSYAKFLVDGK